MPCVKTLGEQVQDYMTGEGLNAPEMGRRVGCSRQNIENLLAGTVRHPSYLADLARVLGTTADALLSGRYVYRANGRSEQVVAQEAMPTAEPWPLAPFITRSQWDQLHQAERNAVAWEASKALRAMTAPPPSAPSISRERAGAFREVTPPRSKNHKPDRKEHK
jgi:transcriptional regulator with XRE-family HTH domain